MRTIVVAGLGLVLLGAPVGAEEPAPAGRDSHASTAAAKDLADIASDGNGARAETPAKGAVSGAKGEKPDLRKDLRDVRGQRADLGRDRHEDSQERREQRRDRRDVHEDRREAQREHRRH